MRHYYFFCLLLFAVVLFADVPASAAADQDAPAGMVLVPAGKFLMGSPLIKDGPVEVYPHEETPRHEVYLGPFYIDIYEVTNGEFAEFLNAVKTADNFEEKRQKWVVIRDDLKSDKKKDWWPTEIMYEKNAYRAVKGLEKVPVISVSWYAADAFCRQKGKRLPTEAEWEKAARGGLPEGRYPWGDAIPTEGIIFKRVWRNNALPSPAEDTGNYYPNGYGLFDMAGNVSEWCADWYDPDYYSKSPGKAPKGPETGTLKIIRGGSWASNAESVRAAFRNFAAPDSLLSGIGFRCAKDTAGEEDR